MNNALALALTAALLLAATVRAARPGGLLRFLWPAWEWWCIFKPRWLPDKPTGGCSMCTAFWVPGVPVAAAGAAWLGCGRWAVAVPVLVGVVFELATEKK